MLINSTQKTNLFFDISFIFFDKELVSKKIVSTFNKYKPAPAHLNSFHYKPLMILIIKKLDGQLF